MFGCLDVWMSALTLPRSTRYADNILKGFANSISIIMTGLISFFAFADFQLTAMFALGAVLVMASTFLYAYKPADAEAKPATTLPTRA
jgi:UDP-sugar transporter A1/2/3